MKLKPKKIDPQKDEMLREEPKEKGDTLAMLMGAFLGLFLPAVIVLLLFGGLIWLIFSLL